MDWDNKRRAKMPGATEPKIDLLASKPSDGVHVSLIASAIRSPLYKMFLASLKETSVNVEVVFVGHVSPDKLIPDEIEISSNITFQYILTEKIKPSQCYEIARRCANGDTVVWVADDCEFKGDVLGKAYRFWKSLNDKKVILSIQTREYYLSGPNSVDSSFCDMTLHSFFGGNPNTPRMAPLGMISREYFEELGGIDRRYICGQYENDVVMRAYADGGRVVMFGDRESYIDIDHIGKQRIVQPGATWHDFQTRPFAKGYVHDRKILEQSWCGGAGMNKVLKNRTDKFEPFVNEDLLTKSQGPRGIWE